VDIRQSPKTDALVSYLFGRMIVTKVVLYLRVIAQVIMKVNLFCYLAILDSRVGHTMDVLSPFISVLCHSD